MVFTKDEEDLISGKKASRGQPKTATQHQSQPHQNDQKSSEIVVGSLLQERQEEGDSLAETTKNAVEMAGYDLASLDRNADDLAKALGLQKAMIVASFQGRVDKYANQYLEQYNAMAIRPLNTGFKNTTDINQWVQDLTTRKVRLPNPRQSAALPESQDKPS